VKDIVSFIIKVSGIDPSIVNIEAFDIILKRIMDDKGIYGRCEYLLWLEDHPEGIQELIEKVVVLETWFFRDEKPFVLLQDRALEKTASSNIPFRVLSVACSTGEEPYSMVMALLDSGVPPEGFVVDAIDISKKALATAKEGIYGKYSFRSNELGFRGRYFRKDGDVYKLSQDVIEKVSFYQGNILDENIAKLFVHYDMVFCRNILIYFNSVSRKKLIHILYKSLKQDGILVIGHSEVGRVVSSHFESLNKRGTFAYRKKEKHDG